MLAFDRQTCNTAQEADHARAVAQMQQVALY
jgi:hypothetical protein